MVALKPLNQQVVVVFGASSGIGRSTAKALVQRGARLVIAARGEEGLAALFDELSCDGGSVVAIAADTADYQSVQRVADRAIEAYGCIDTWVHAAAVTVFVPVATMTPQEFKQVIEINLLGQIYGMLAALPHLRRQGRGALIHISSVLGKRAVPYQSAYCASKHGLEGMLESLRVELQHEGMPISVTSIMPASINTPLYDNGLTKLGVRPMPVPPVYDPESVADAIVYAAEHPVRDIVVGGSGAALVWGQRLVPQLLDSLILRFGFAAQKTDQPKAAAAPNNLFEPQTGDRRIDGSWSEWVQPASLFTRPALDPLSEATANVVQSATMLAANAAQMLSWALPSGRRPASRRHLEEYVEEL